MEMTPYEREQFMKNLQNQFDEDYKWAAIKSHESKTQHIDGNIHIAADMTIGKKDFDKDSEFV